MRFLFLLSLSVVSFSLWAESATYDYNYGELKISTNLDGSQKVQLDNLAPTMEGGKPRLPFSMVKILLPLGKRVEGIKVIRFDEKTFSLNPEMVQIETPYGFSSAQIPQVSFEDFSPTQKDMSALSSWEEQKWRGYNVLLARIHPVYVSMDKKVHAAKKIKIEISLSDEVQKSFDESFEIDRNHVEVVTKFVDQRSVKNLSSYEEGSYVLKRFEDENYDYLIITSKELMSVTGANDLNVFKKFLETERKLKVKIVDEKIAEASEVGRDRAEKLRNFLKKEYQNYKPRYLLLVGDTTDTGGIIPLRRFYSQVKAYDGTWKLVTEEIASDQYYACLDGTFDGNNNGKFGEKNDGVGGGDVDFLCELTVGRFPVETASELNVVIQKTLQAYRMEKHDKKVLLMGEELFAQAGLWGGDYMDQLVGTVTDHGFTTKGYDSSWKVDKLYDDKNTGDTWASYQARKLINEGDYLIVNHLGHSNTSYNMRMYSYNSALQNPLPFFYYTQGCFPGYFVAQDSFIEKWMYTPNGPFAVVANSNYGLGPEDPAPETTKAPGTSQILHRFFTNRILGEDYMAFGEAHQKSKEDLLIYIDHPEARWVTWEATFFGDPALKISL